MMMSGKQYICGYKHCLHKNEKVSLEELVLIWNRHYHKDCAEIKRRIIECAELYMSYIEDKTQYPTVLRIINTLTFKNKVPIEYTYRSIANSKPIIRTSLCMSYMISERYFGLRSSRHDNFLYILR